MKNSNSRINELARHVNVIRVVKASDKLSLVERLAVRRAERKNIEQEKVSLTDRLAVRRAARKDVSFDAAKASIASCANHSVTTKTTKRAKSSKHDCVAYIEMLISQSCYTHKEIVSMTCSRFDDLALITVRTYLTDSKNERYFRVHKFDRLTLTSANKILHY